MNKNLFRQLIVLSGSVGLSFSGIFVRFSTAPTPVLVLYRMIITSAILSVPALAGRENRARLKSLDGKLLFCFVLSGFLLAVHFFSYFNAVKATSVASATILTDSEVFFTGLAGYLLYRERISPASIAGIFIAFSGCILITMNDAGGGAHMLKGDLLALLSAAAMAGYTMIGRTCRQYISTSLFTWSAYLGTALFSFAALKAGGLPVLGYEPVNYLTALGMGVVSTLLGHNIFSWGLKYFNAATISLFKLAEPVFAAILAVFFFREIPSPMAIAGSFIILSGIWWYLKNSRT